MKTDPGTYRKVEMRREFLLRRERLGVRFRLEAEKAIIAQLRGWPVFARARWVACYRSDGMEPDLTALFDERFCFPRWNGVDYELAFPGKAEGYRWQTGRYGLPEPTGDTLAGRDAEDGLWLVPGLAFDCDGRRLGRGGGWYDRLLSGARGVLAGVFFSVQQAEKVPEEAHDRRLQWIITEKAISDVVWD